MVDRFVDLEFLELSKSLLHHWMAIHVTRPQPPEFLLQGHHAQLRGGRSGLLQELLFEAAFGNLKIPIGQKFETFKVRAKTYNKVLITGIDDIGVKIRHEAGSARLKFVELPASMRKQFGYNPAASAKARENEKVRETELAKLTEEDRKKLMEKEAERRAARSVWEKKEEKIKAAKTIKVLESKIRKLKLGTSQARADIEGLRGRANRYRSEATSVVSRTDRNGNIVSETRVSKGKLKMADNYDRKAEQERVKIDVAKDMMDRYDDEIRDLRRLLQRK